MVGTAGGRYLYDGVEIAGVATSGTTIAARQVRGPWPDELVVSYSGSPTVTTPRWSLQDHLMSTVAITDATGAAVSTLAYDEYGVPRSGNGGRFQYTGQLWMQDFGVYHYKARAYQPALGRFLQTDPIGYAAGANVYSYVGGDPINFIDPTGLTDRPPAPPGYIYPDDCVRAGELVTRGGVTRCRLNSSNYSWLQERLAGGTGGADGAGDNGGPATDNQRCASLIRGAKTLNDVSSAFGYAALGASAVGAFALAIPEPASKVIAAGAFGAATGISAVGTALSFTSAGFYGAATGDWGRATLLGLSQGFENSAFGRGPFQLLGGRIADSAGGALTDRLYGEARCG